MVFSPVKHLVAISALEAHLVPLAASSYNLLSHVYRLATFRALCPSTKTRRHQAAQTTHSSSGQQECLASLAGPDDFRRTEKVVRPRETNTLPAYDRWWSAMLLPEPHPQRLCNHAYKVIITTPRPPWNS